MYTFKNAPYPNTNSWYREIIFDADGEPVGEINEPADSTAQNKIYNVCRFEPLQICNGTAKIPKVMRSFPTVSECKDYIHSEFQPFN